MKIEFDAQLLFEEQKTGIGWTVNNILNSIIEVIDNEYCLNYFSLFKGKEKEKVIKKYREMGFKSYKCSWFHNVVYSKMWNVLPIPYSLFFNNKAQITQFFNYSVPPGVKGKAITFVYDMVYKAFPETVSKKTMKMLDNNLIKSCSRADHIITISEFSKNEIIKYMHIPEHKISIMPCGVDLSIYHPNYAEEDVIDVKKRYGISGDYILYLGTLEPRKNIESLVEAYAQLKEKCSNLPKLVLAGKKGWLYNTIFEKVELYQLTSDVIFTDYVDIHDVPVLLNGALMFVFPSLYEGFGLPPLEAMACGTPVIVSNKSSLPEVVGDAGYLIDPYSIEELKDTIQLLISDEDLRERMKEKGLIRSKSFSWKSSVTQLMEIYKSLLMEKK